MQKGLSFIKNFVALLILVSLILLIVPITATGCTGNQTATPASSDLEDVVITLERTACKGTCPVYKLTIYGSGTVIYEGKDYVTTKGKVESTINEGKIAQLVAEFEKIDYFSLNDSYVERVITDAPSAITSITLGGETKSITHYHGDLNAPEELEELEDKIDEIVNSEQWIK